MKKRIPLTDHDRRVLVTYGMRIKDRLHGGVKSIVEKSLEKLEIISVLENPAFRKHRGELSKE